MHLFKSESHKNIEHNGNAHTVEAGKKKAKRANDTKTPRSSFELNLYEYIIKCANAPTKDECNYFGWKINGSENRERKRERKNENVHVANT